MNIFLLFLGIFWIGLSIWIGVHLLKSISGIVQLREQVFDVLVGFILGIGGILVITLNLVGILKEPSLIFSTIVALLSVMAFTTTSKYRKK